ncbi:MAG TPA: zinc ribbon domain-containing protein [Candidatus Methylomirabilis sp.]|nr:zinc ribbon domain-containing protein [Candidatus Methylomirabilis sp.]
MPLRLFGGQGGSRVRACPACEREIAADATFCPSCYMVIRPEGAAALREHLRGGRIPADVYLLRKMQAEDPNAGPVVRESGIPSPPSAPEPVAPQNLPLAAPAPAPAPEPNTVAAAPQPPPLTPVHSLPTKPVESLTSETETAPPARVWRGAQSLLRFVPPLPPPTHTADEASALLTWMLQRDPIIPNNLELLEALHAGIFQKGPAAHLGYQPHLLIQIADDLVLHPNQETLDIHLGLLVTAYRRAAGAYHAAMNKGEDEKNAALWQMASMASRLRVEAWVYRTRYGVAPSAPRPRRSRASRVSAD